MEAANVKTGGAPATVADLAKVVKIKPATSKDKAIKVILPKDMYNAPVADVIKYVMANPAQRADERIAERVSEEMKKDYGVTVNAQPVKGAEAIGAYFVKKTTPGGIEYEEAEIIIAAEQKGGFGGLENLI